MKVAIILPSRGLMFSRTADEILRNVKDIPHQFFFSHGRPIPECFDRPTTTALARDDITHLWLVEDDMILPSNTLQLMLDMDKAVVTADYPVNKNGRGAILRDKGGKVLITGTGCLLVKREVFDELKYPYFRTDIRWTAENMGGYLRLTAQKNQTNDGYGLHDVNFSMMLHHLGIPIHLVDFTLGQRKLISLGKAGSNNGAHKIEQWSKVKKDFWLKQLMAQPVRERGKLTTVLTESGEITVTPEHAKKLIDLGKATKPPFQYSVIDENGLI
jgi:hypothetical protein